MPDPSYQTTAITIRGVEGNDVTVSETHERKELVLSINEHRGDELYAAVRLSKEQFEALCQARFTLEVQSGVPAAGEEK
jgi:hypothetical protein